MQHIDSTKSLTATGGTSNLNTIDQELREGDSVTNALLCNIQENVFEADQDLEWVLITTGNESEITPKQPAHMVTEAFLVAGLVVAKILIPGVTNTELGEEQITEFTNAISELLNPLSI
jgi:hypothetical protein